MSMNRYDVEDTYRYFQHQRDELPNLAEGAMVLIRLMAWTNSHSDGWPYWQKPSRAAARLMELLHGRYQQRYRSSTVEDATRAELVAAFRPIKAFLTRQGVDHTIIFGG